MKLQIGCSNYVINRGICVFNHTHVQTKCPFNGVNNNGSIHSYIWTLGSQLIEMFEKGVWPWWKRCATMGRFPGPPFTASSLCFMNEDQGVSSQLLLKRHACPLLSSPLWWLWTLTLEIPSQKETLSFVHFIGHRVLSWQEKGHGQSSFSKKSASLYHLLRSFRTSPFYGDHWQKYLQKGIQPTMDLG